MGFHSALRAGGGGPVSRDQDAPAGLPVLSLGKGLTEQVNVSAAGLRAAEIIRKKWQRKGRYGWIWELCAALTSRRCCGLGLWRSHWLTSWTNRRAPQIVAHGAEHASHSRFSILAAIQLLHLGPARQPFRVSLPRSPLSKASARGGLRSFNKDSSWGLASSMSRSKAGLSKPWGDEAMSPGDEWGCCAPGGCRCRELEVPGTAILRKSMRGRSVGENWSFTSNDPQEQASEGNSRTWAHTWQVTVGSGHRRRSNAPSLGLRFSWWLWTYRLQPESEQVGKNTDVRRGSRLCSNPDFLAYYKVSQNRCFYLFLFLKN